jgi:hypothetical protein
VELYLHFNLQPPIQWVPGALSLGVKRPGSEADHTLPYSAKVKNAWSYTSTPPVCLHGVVLRRKEKGQLLLGRRAGLDVVMKKKIPLRELNCSCPARSLVIILTELPC